MTVTIRPFTRIDMDGVCSIERASFTDPWTPLMFSEELFDKGYNFGRVAVEEETGEIAGYCFFWIVAGDEVQIGNIAVRPDLRRRGIAQILIDESIQMGREREATSISLEVRESNDPARRFYAKLGFQEVGKRPRYYRNPTEDAYILRRSINEPVPPIPSPGPEGAKYK